MGANIAEGLRAMVLGMGVVFSALFVLYLVLLQFEKVFGNGSPSTHVGDDAGKQIQADHRSVADDSSDDELVAIISSILSQYSQTDRSNLVIRKITRTA